MDEHPSRRNYGNRNEREFRVHDKRSMTPSLITDILCEARLIMRRGHEAHSLNTEAVA
ncbi:hypothetical protein K0M31_004020, partial [Melipona bicolor]